MDGAFDPTHTEIADAYRTYGRCLMVVDEKVLGLHGEQIRAYFAHHRIDLTVCGVRIAETAKSLGTVERIVDAFGEFGLVRTEPVLVVGGGLTTDVAGFACASFRRGTPYIRVPTTVIWGGQDRIVSARLARRTAATVPDARLAVLPDAGHVAQMEVPERVAGLVAGAWDAQRDGRWWRVPPERAG